MNNLIKYENTYVLLPKNFTPLNEKSQDLLSYYFKSWLIYPLNLRLYPASFLSIINGIKSYRKIRREKIR